MPNIWHDVVMRRLTRRWRYFLWDSVLARREETEMSIQSGVRMRLYTNDRLSRLIYTEDFESEERRFLNAFLRPADIFVDVGANIGLFTLIAGYRVREQGRVYAFEPTAKPFRRLLTNVASNRFTNVECFQTALSDRAGRMVMAASLDGYDAWNSLGSPVAGSAFTEEPVDCIRWDDFARDRDLGGCVTMMKIDVEGWEQRVLRGGAETFARNDAPVLQVEFADAAARSAGSSCEEVYRQLVGFGYRVYVFDPFTGTVREDPLRDNYPYVNLIAAKRREQIEGRLEHHVD